ncbi:response regulator [Campylobacter geochelonis]|uniref:NADPH-dependent 7-cyano-7-deazaguanine reductase n=1 Tax=Campylobacter geochelonis TaxID=1780362 RepID=A0A128EBZ0_9BACT|nr:7-cyano-7-deazaguanine reductase [Campylobacter geochelonis]CZE46170.1 response regulator [Campylobacter geochelonis]CZE46459.1 response regulator [Campylobacter geochelonis]CZE50765.1 response regulator [Campylobacter geochelonis]
MRYGEEIIKEFDVESDLEIWPNKQERDYLIKITLPEFMCLCPRSGYPDFATIYLEYMPGEFVVELKAIKLYINSFINRNISHEDSINEIYSVLQTKLKPKWMKIIGDFNPRGNVHTVIEIDSNLASKDSQEKPQSANNDEIIDAIKEEFKKEKEQEKLEREERKKSFNDRKPRDGVRSFSDRKPREGGFGDRKPRREFDKKDGKSFDKKPRVGGYSDRKPRDRDDKFDDKPRVKKEPFYKSNFSDRKPQVVKKDDKS